MAQLQVLLAKRGTYIFLVCFALLIHFKHEIYFPQITSDEGVQIQAAKGYTEGKGFANYSAPATDLSKEQCTPLKLWPVGFSMFLVLSWHIFHDWILAALFWQLTGVCTLLFSMLRILNLFRISDSLKSVFVLFFALNASPSFYWATTDMLAAGIFLWAAGLALKQATTGNFGLGICVLIAVLSTVNCTLRFASIPNMVIIPGFYLLMGLMRKEKGPIIAAFVIGGCSLLFTFLFFSVFSIDHSRTSFLEDIKHMNFLWSNLKWFDSFPLKAFFYMSPIEYRFPVSHPGMIRIGRLLIHFLSLCILSFFGWKLLIRDKIQLFRASAVSEQRLLFSYVLLMLVFSCAVIGLMSLESITSAPERNSFGPPWMPNMWTFVYCTRYFAVIMLMLQLLLFILLSRTTLQQERRTVFLLRGLAGASLVYGFLFFGYSNYQMYSPHGNGGASYWYNEKEEVEIYRTINRIHKQEPASKLVYAEADQRNDPMTVFSEATTCENYNAIVSGHYAAGRHLVLLLKMHPANLQTSDEQLFIQMHHAKLLIGARNSELYRVDI